ncbi:MAG: VOC family protein [Bacteroidia bacterium]|nr:VOC family protein [Bacteroidia bacterium]
MSYIISGIQQLGVGNTNVHETFKWYRQAFGTDIKIFEEAAMAELMLPYTDNKPHARHAILAISMNGGGGFEIWQYTSRTAQKTNFTIQLGDLGIFAGKIKSFNIQESYNHLKKFGAKLLTEITQSPDNRKHFYLLDLWGNVFEVIEEKTSWYQQSNFSTGGILGAVIGVSDINKSIGLYQTVLGFDKIISDTTAEFMDWKGVEGAHKKFRRVVLRNSKPREGSFGPLLGDNEIELIQALDYSPRKIYENRLWGDCGFIHLCFDIKNMKALEEACKKAGQPFTVDGGAGFEMGEAAGHFTYIEDGDGTLIEFVETKKLPVIKKIGWYLDLRKRDPKKPLPNFILKALRFSRVKD